ncbi:hypothetical protein OC844_004178 [Tilletia horrida]|nr:hypothetical protein OC844_004178 [Tilletia horrida]
MMLAAREAARRGVRVSLRVSARVATRPFSQSTAKQDSDGASQELRAYVSTSHDPTFNLALEDHLFRTTSLTRARPWRPSKDNTDDEAGARPLCLIYRNRPCVVIGRNQNPWKELNVREMARLGIPMVRRRSGGGSVFHDLGNTNYSIHVPKDIFTKRANAELVARSLNALIQQYNSNDEDSRLQPSVYVNHRSDICVRISPLTHTALPAPDDPATQPPTPDPAERKLSGSAYKLTAQRAYHHGTLLLDADLSALGHALRNSRGDALQSKGVASVRASVVNLLDAFPSARGRVTHRSVAQAIVSEFGRTYAADGAEERLMEHIPLEPSFVGPESELIAHGLLDRHSEAVLRESLAELQSWDWLYGQTPEFTHALVANSSSTQRSSAHPAAAAVGLESLKGKTHEGDMAPTAAAFPHGSFTLLLHCRRGIIERAELSGPPPATLSKGSTSRSQPIFPDAATESLLRALLQRLEGKRYDDFAEELPSFLNGRTEDSFAEMQTQETVDARLSRALDLLGFKDSNKAEAEDEKRRVALSFVRWLREVL